MYFICIWVDQPYSDVQFENSVPILYLGKWLERNSCQEQFHIIFLYGKNRLDKDYLKNVKQIKNFHIYDYESDYKILKNKYTSLERFGNYERNCFLRWLIIDLHLKQQAITGHFIHIDGDIMFNALPKEILADTKDLTFVLQGCPGFVSVNNYSWFDQYRNELDVFTENIESYSKTAWEERNGWEQTYKLKWAGNRFRKIITSDQDFVSHLIHTNRIIQDYTERFVKNSKLYYAENPLYLASHAWLQTGKSNNLSFTIQEATCFVEDKKVAVWHFQGNFLRYINHQIILAKMYPFRIPNELETNRIIRYILQFISKYLKLTRLQVYLSIKEFNNGKGKISLKEIFNNRRFWKKDVFIS